MLTVVAVPVSPVWIDVDEELVVPIDDGDDATLLLPGYTEWAHQATSERSAAAAPRLQ